MICTWLYSFLTDNYMVLNMDFAVLANAVNCKAWFSLQGKTTTTIQKQNNHKVEQSSFMLIALFELEIGRFRGHNSLNGKQALHGKHHHHDTRTKQL